MSFKTIDLSSDKSTYYKLVDGMNKCRVLSEAIEVWTAFNRTEKTAKKYLKKELADTDPEAKKRWAMWVLDRNDGKVKVAEFGASIVSQIQKLAKDEDYGFEVCPMPYDLKIVREGSGLDTEYTVTPSPISPLTSEEEIKVGFLERLEDFFAKEKGVVLSLDTNTAPF